MSVTQKEIVQALTGSWLVPDGVDADAWIAVHQTELAMRIEVEGIAPTPPPLLITTPQLNDETYRMESK